MSSSLNHTITGLPRNPIKIMSSSLIIILVSLYDWGILIQQAYVGLVRGCWCGENINICKCEEGASIRHVLNLKEDRGLILWFNVMVLKHIISGSNHFWDLRCSKVAGSNLHSRSVEVWWLAVQVLCLFRRRSSLKKKQASWKGGGKGWIKVVVLRRDPCSTHDLHGVSWSDVQDSAVWRQ